MYRTYKTIKSGEQQPPHNDGGCNAFTPVGLGSNRRKVCESKKRKKEMERNTEIVRQTRHTHTRFGDAIIGNLSVSRRCLWV